MKTTHAIVRRPGPEFLSGLTSQAGDGGSYERCLIEHAEYVAALEATGVQVRVLPALDRFPDAHFVEDVAVITPEIAVLTRPGAEARRGEVEAMEPALINLGARDGVERIIAPGTLEGGDVLFLGRNGFIGLSGRTNRAGAEQLQALLEPRGYRIRFVPVDRGLHLKTSVNAVGPDVVLLTPEYGDQPAFSSFRRIETAPDEAPAANTLLVNDHLLVPAGFPTTTDRLTALNRPIRTVPTTQAQRMDGGLTCLSLRKGSD